MTIEFSPVTELMLGGQPSRAILLASDLNGDGNLDLITDFEERNSGSQTTKSGVAVLYGTGDGQFTAVQKYELSQVVPNSLTLPISVKDIAVGDVDRDGKLDLITVGQIPASTVPLSTISFLSVFKGTGTSFLPPTNSAITNYGSIALADFNSDGNLDIAASGNYAVIANAADPSITKLGFQLGDGTGQFGSETIIDLGIFIYKLIAADFNGDGQADLAVVGSTFRAFSTSVLLSNGAGGFGTPNTLSDFKANSAVDINKDGKIDLVSDQDFVLGDGTGQFSSPQRFDTSDTTVLSAQVAADFNGDGNLDLVRSGLSDSLTNDLIAISLRNSKGDYSLPSRVSNIDYFIGSAAVGDFDRDGKLDIATVGNPRFGILDGQSRKISVFLNRTTGADLIAFGEDAIDVSLEQDGVILDLKKGTLQVGGASKSFTGVYQRARGTQQADRIIGGQVGESIDGLAGKDILVGAEGNDFLAGGFDNDTLTGGKGKDGFVFSYNGIYSFPDQLTPFNRIIGIDKITDFEVGKDKIYLYRTTFTAFTSRRISFESVETKKAAQKSKALIAYVPKTGSLFYNQNGAKAGFGAGGLFADLTNGLELRAKDLLLS